MMSPTNLEEANALVLSRIGQMPEGSILGFLPLSQSEEDAVLQVVKDVLSGERNFSMRGLLIAAPAATAYALAVAPSRTLTTGGNFWPALATDLAVVRSRRRYREPASPVAYQMAAWASADSGAPRNLSRRCTR